MIEVKLLKDVGPYKKGETRRFDPVSAENLVKDKRGQIVKTPDDDA